VVFSGNGTRLASAIGADKTVRVWEAQTGQEILTLKGHTGAVWSVAFSPDGRRIASASRDETVKVWDAHSGQEQLTLKGHTGAVSTVVFSPNGKRIVSGGTGHDPKTNKIWGEVKVWDAGTGQETLTLKGHTELVRSVCYSPDGRRIASGNQDRTVKVWDAHTGQQALSLKGHTAFVNSVCFSPDGRRIASASEDRTVKVWDAATGQEILSLKGHTGRVNSACFSPDGRRIASGSEDRTVKVWDAHSGQETLSLMGHTNSVWSVCFSPDGKRIASAGDGSVRLWDTDTGRQGQGAPEEHTLRVEVDTGLGFHTAGVESSERAGDWFAASFHAGWLLKLRPWDAGLHIRRAHALSQIGQADQAATQFLHALFLNPRAHLLPTDPQAFHRGEAAASSKDWPRASEAFASAVYQPRAWLDDWKRLLLCRRAARQNQAYRQDCTDLLDRFGNTPDRNTLQGLVQVCQLGPCSEADSARLVRIAERLVAGGRNALTRTWLGCALYRAGRLGEAVRVLEESIKAHGKGGYVDSWVFLALAHQQLGHADKARECFARFEDSLNKQNFAKWEDRLYWQLLEQEARAPRMPRIDAGK
jgi:tetratricopeptide (TPR) repeat protein/Tol biopolymer transport system component